MSQTADTLPTHSQKTFMGHPVGLFVLFFTEMWERFSYYGMRGLLKLYMVNYLFVTARQVYQGGAYDATKIADPNSVFGWGFIQTLLPKLNAAEAVQCIQTKVAILTHGDAVKGLQAVSADVAQRIAEQTCSVEPRASVIYGWYTGLVYLTPLLGGWMADRYLGQRRSVLMGGLVMAAGQFLLFGAENMFFIGLLLLIVGNGFFKPNISTQVGSLYPEGDPRRDGAFTIFYMGINLGAFLCNFVAGTLAMVYGWRYGFLASGFGMLIGVAVQLAGARFLAPDTLAQRRAERAKAGADAAKTPAVSEPLTSNEWRRVWALVALCALNVIFWAVYEQQGNTMQTWADEQTIWPSWASSTWFQSVNPFFIFLLAPFLDYFWRRQAKKGTEPSSVSKMVIGCFVLGLSFIVMIVGANIVGSGKGSWLWPIACTLMLTIGELYLSPIGLSLVTKVSPVRIVSLMMGMWFLSSFFGNILSGYIGQLYTSMSKDAFFFVLMVLGLGSGAMMWAFNKPLKKALHHESDAAAV
ncbi:MAG: peptide MFS transporter [Myxococcota bacterium]